MPWEAQALTTSTIGSAFSSSPTTRTLLSARSSCSESTSSISLAFARIASPTVRAALSVALPDM